MIYETHTQVQKHYITYDDEYSSNNKNAEKLYRTLFVLNSPCLMMTWEFTGDNKAHEKNAKITTENNFTRLPLKMLCECASGGTRGHLLLLGLCAWSNGVCPQKIRTTPWNNRWHLINTEWQGPVAATLYSPAPSSHPVMHDTILQHSVEGFVLVMG